MGIPLFRHAPLLHQMRSIFPAIAVIEAEVQLLGAQIGNIGSAHDPALLYGQYNIAPEGFVAILVMTVHRAQKGHHFMRKSQVQRVHQHQPVFRARRVRSLLQRAFQEAGKIHFSRIFRCKHHRFSLFRQNLDASDHGIHGHHHGRFLGMGHVVCRVSLQLGGHNLGYYIPPFHHAVYALQSMDGIGRIDFPFLLLVIDIKKAVQAQGQQKAGYHNG